jgi:hypothetical protein
MEVKHTIKQIANTLLQASSTWQEKYECLQNLHNLLVANGGLDAYIPDTEEDDLWLEEGCAISPKSAAMCMFEIIRTEQFLKGLYKAIEDMLQQTEERPIRIMDAGSGPYALFTILSALFFSPTQVQYQVYDIHSKNIDSVTTLIKNLGLTAYVEKIVVADLCTVQFENHQKPHIIITEVMKNALQKEPQLAVTLHLNRQLATNGIFIPQNISLDMVMVDGVLHTALNHNLPIASSHQVSVPLGNICNLNKESTSDEFTANPLQTLTVPDIFGNSYNRLQVETGIQVYKECVLKKRDSSITFPLVISDPSNPVIKGGEKINFYFTLEHFPKLKYMVH